MAESESNQREIALCPFQKQIFADLVPESGLLVLAKGLGLFYLVRTFVELYAVPQLLVFLLGTTSQQEAFLQQHYTAGFEELKNKVPFKIIKNDTSARQRAEMYLHGGVIAITSRIMLIDLLCERLPAHLTTGIMILRAERVTEFSAEAFILELYRERNTEGFIKAFSETAESLVGGFSKIEKTLKFLKTPKIFLLPRFHTTVKADLDSVPLEVEELQVALTPNMRLIQLGLLEVLETCVNELVRANPTALDGTQFTAEGAITIAFEAQIRRQLDPIWHRVSLKSKQLLGELRTIRLLLEYLTAFDATSYLRFLETIIIADMAAPGTGGFQSHWLMLDVAQGIIQAARDRVFRAGSDRETLQPNIEMLPKWQILNKLLNEKRDQTVNLIMVREEHTRRHLVKLLKMGEEPWKKNKFAEYCKWRKGARLIGGLATGVTASVGRMSAKRPRKYIKITNEPTPIDEALSLVGVDEASPTTLEIDEDLLDEEGADIENVIIQCFDDNQYVDHEQMLRQVRPNQVILYDGDLAFLRALELTCLRWQDAPHTLYILLYAESVEEQRQLLAIRQEKEAFEQLVKAKAAMAPLSFTFSPAGTLTEDDATLMKKFMGWEESLPRKITVDLRELRSSLPFILHRQGFQINPRTIAVGDYVLTPKRCVERKSVSDLISSLNSGRLYGQIEALQRHYETPILLIEFDENRPFSLLPADVLRSDISISDISSKLCLLLLHFPRLRIIWSSSLAGTADIFRELKRDEPEPTVNGPLVGEGEEIDPTARDILMSLPGINSSNSHLIMRHVRCLRDLAQMTLADLTDLLGGEMARRLYAFLHEPLIKSQTSKESSPSASSLATRQSEASNSTMTSSHNEASSNNKNNSKVPDSKSL